MRPLSLRFVVILAAIAGVIDPGLLVLRPEAQSAWAQSLPGTPKPPQYFARRDAERYATRARQIAEQNAPNLQAFLNTQSQLQTAISTQQKLDKSIKELAENLKPLEPLKAHVAQLTASLEASQKSAAVNPELQQKVQTTAAQVNELTAQLNKLLAERGAPLQAATTQKQAVDKQVVDLTAAVKPLAEAKGKLELPIQQAVQTAQQALDRLLLLEGNVVAPVPSQTRLVQRFNHNRGLLTCRFDAEGDFLWTGAEDNSLRRWDLVNGTGDTFNGHTSWVSSLAFAGERSPIVSTGYEGKMLWWDVQAVGAPPIRTVEAHKGFIRTITVSKDGRFLATAGNDLLIKIWNAADGSPVTQLTGHAAHIYNIAFSPDSQQLISGDLMGVVKQWKVDGWQPVRDLDAGVLHKYDPTFKAHVGGIRAIDFSPDGKWLALGGMGEVSNAFAGVGKPIVALFDWQTGVQVRVLEPGEALQGSVWGLRFTRDGNYLIGAGGGSGGAIWFWDPFQAKSVHHVKLDQVARDLDMHPDGLRLVIPLYDNSIRVFDMTPLPEKPAPPAK